MSEGMELKIIRTLIAAAYEDGWRAACDDHIVQRNDPDHPIGASKKPLNEVLYDLDPRNLIGLRDVMGQR